MRLKAIVTENWLTQKPRAERSAARWVALAAAGIGIATYGYWNDAFHFSERLPATPALVFGQHEYWRAWTTLFAHADLAHLVGNLVLFIPFGYLLSAYFGAALFPFLGFLFGGITNLLVLRTMPSETGLIGASGIVYWMGATWITLWLLVDRREERTSRRILRALGVAIVLFVPEQYRPETSHLAHAIGALFGVGTALGWYAFRRREFLEAERIEFRFEEGPRLRWGYREVEILVGAPLGEVPNGCAYARGRAERSGDEGSAANCA